MMISPRNALAALLLLISGTTVTAQAFEDASDLSETWTATVNPVGEGNGAFMSPDGQTLVVASSDCTLTAYDPSSGMSLWTYTPTDAAAQCSGGVFFSYGDGTRADYLVYSTVSGGATTVLAVNPTDGTLVLSANVAGTAVGTPVTTSDGSQILVTTNPTLNSGLFTVIDISDTSTPALEFPITGRRVSGIGAYWNPPQGYYEGGENNMNDIFVFGQDWDADPVTNVNGTIGRQRGQMYAFQNPIIPDQPLEVTLVGGERSILSNLPPVLANDGFNLYWAAARSNLFCWAGEAGLGRNDFNSGSLNTLEFQRGRPGYAAPKAPPVTSSGGEMTPTGEMTPLFVYGAGAANQVFRTDEECTDAGSSNYTFPDVTTVVANKVLLSVDDLYLYVSTPKGDLHFFSAERVANGPRWTYPLGGSIVGEMAMSLDGSHIYTADVTGVVKATRVGEALAVPTIAPSDSVAAMPTMAPVVAPITPPTDGEVVIDLPDLPTLAPVTDGTEAPSFSMMPVGDFVAEPPVVETAPVTPPVLPPIFVETPAPSAASSVVLTLGALVVVAVSMMLV